MGRAKGKDLFAFQVHNEARLVGSLCIRQAYASFTSPQAATAVKRKVESLGDGGDKYKQKFSVSFSNPFLNPFKTLPKDGNRKDGTNRNYNNSPNQSSYNSGGYRGGRGGGYNNRGSVGYNNRGGFQQPQQPPMTSGYPTGGFQAGAPMPSYGGSFSNRGGPMSGGGGMRGGPMGMRGGRGGGAINSGMMPMPMGMGGPMPGPMPMGMPQMNGAMGMQGRHLPSTIPTRIISLFPQHPHILQRTKETMRLRQPLFPLPALSSHSMSTTRPPAPRQLRSIVGADHSGARQAISPPPFSMAVASSAAVYNLPLRPSMISTPSSSQPLSEAERSKRSHSDQFAGFPNPGFFPQQQDASWNPHGAKRTRQE